MLVTAEQIRAALPVEPERGYPATRRSRLLPAEPCRNAYRGCQGSTKEKQCGHGWCRKHDDSWYHAPDLRYCLRADCFMKGTEGHP